VTGGRSRTERVSDADREAAVGLLQSHVVAGRLDPDELAERAERAYRAKTVTDLDEALRDLPADRARPQWRPASLRPLLLTAAGAGTTAVTAVLDGGFRGPFDGVAAVPMWATIATLALLAARRAAGRLLPTART
jgi:hypothetical protein